jgi:pimeloyl-ACP methyl ester carboxylesterase
MAKSIPDPAPAVVMGVGHAVHLEAPEMVAEFVGFRN